MPNNRVSEYDRLLMELRILEFCTGQSRSFKEIEDHLSSFGGETRIIQEQIRAVSRTQELYQSRPAKGALYQTTEVGLAAIKQIKDQLNRAQKLLAKK